MEAERGVQPGPLSARVITNRWDGVIGVGVAPVAMIAILFAPHEKLPSDPYPLLTLVGIELALFVWLCIAAVLLIRPPRVELDEWGFRAFDPFRGTQARSWDDCGDFRVRRLNGSGAVYMAGPTFNADLPVWKSWNLQLPIVIGAHVGMSGPKFADLLNQYRDAFATHRPASSPGGERQQTPPDAAGSSAPSVDPHGGIRGEGSRDWLGLDPPSPDM